ncbi:MAG TPA: methyltransferase domain-containing protein [Gemmatimonadales bacterium]|jgi:ubiquinone/menaquinone biosynthesis C-methylase UbiE|nr:methyltransferase domain-containing protein [Gemmatimonadales bacterium]
MIGTELLDDPRSDPVLVGRELRDIARLNALFGGTRAVVRELKSFFERRRAMGIRKRETWTLLDVGTGSGDIALAARTAARQLDIDLKAIGLELNPTAARIASAAGVPTIVADGSALPLGPRSVDVVVASQVLHHLPRPVAVRWIATLDRIARRVVVLADLRRSRVAMAGVWAASVGLAMSGVTRHDAVVSLKRGYTKTEFDEMLRQAGVRTVARYRRGARIVAAWSPSTE